MSFDKPSKYLANIGRGNIPNFFKITPNIQSQNIGKFDNNMQK
jgi:hypothetical protein